MMSHKHTCLNKIVSCFVASAFIFSSIVSAGAQSVNISSLQVNAATPISVYQPMMLKGVTLYPDNPFKFDFIIDRGDEKLSEREFKKQSEKLIKYFLASLTVPEKDMWVNLSPYEKNRIIPDNFGSTEMGRDLLAQDYILKQLTASLMYPEKELGREFWSRLEKQAKDKFGEEKLPIDTFNKVWIVPKEATVYEHEKGAFVVSSHLSVMLEEDYLALEANAGHAKHGLGDVKADELHRLNSASSEVIRELILPEIEKEVNQGRSFANLRQIYHSMILAVWFKRVLKESIFSDMYIDQSLTQGVENSDSKANEKIYENYLKAFKDGAYDYIREDYNPATQEVTARHYFSGGATAFKDEHLAVERRRTEDLSEILKDVDAASLTVELDSVEASKKGLVSFQDQRLQKFVDDLRNDKNNPFTDVSLEAAIAELDGLAEGALGKGGLGFLTGDTWGAYKLLDKFKGLGVMPLYLNHYDGQVPIDWDRQKGIEPVRLKNGQPLSFNVDFNFRSYPVQIYWVNRNGMPVFLIKSPDFFKSLYPGGAEQTRQYGFLARAYVELIKKLGIRPKIVRLSEPQLVFVATAMQNDVKFFNNIPGEESVFKNSQVVFTTHTPEKAALPVFYNLNDLREQVGAELFDAIARDGKVDAAEALANIANVINGVSLEHGRVTKVAVLPSHAWKTTAVQNGNEEATWYSPQLRDYVARVGLGNVKAEDLYAIGTERKEQDLQDLLQNSYGVKFADPKRPLVGLVRRLVAYKEQRMFIPLVRWITGDPLREYFHPETGESLGNGLGANLLIGGHALDDVSPLWVQKFKELMEDPEIKGKFIYVKGTGIQLRKLAVAASDIWVSIPRPTREASGTSDGAAALNGTVNIATATGGPLSYIRHGVSGWLIDVFKGRNLDEVINRFNQGNVEIIKEFYEKGGRELAQYLREGVTIYRSYVERGDRKWLDMMMASFIDGHKEVSIEVMVQKYGLLFESVLDGTGARGYEEKMKNFSYVPEGLEVDRASLEEENRVGGIDLNPENMYIYFSQESRKMYLPAFFDRDFIKPVEGLIPVIINITPSVNLPLLLGVSDDDLQEEEANDLSLLNIN